MTSRRDFVKHSVAASLMTCTSSFMTFGRILYADDEAFFKACSNGDIVQVKTMLEDNSRLLTAKDRNGLSGFALAMLAGHRPTADFLTNAGYATDLHESAMAGDWERYELLLGDESASTVDIVNADHAIGGSVIWAAAAGGVGSDIWHVYANCADPNLNTRDTNGTTPLQKALRFHQLAAAEITAATLLSNDANPNPKLNADLPPLHIAAQRGSYVLTEMLIRLGADVSARDQNGKLARTLAEEAGHKDIWELITHHTRVARTCRTSRARYTASRDNYVRPDVGDIPLYLKRRFVGQSHGNLEYVQKALQEDSRLVHSIATTSEKCVEACAHTGRKKVVEHLLKHGAPYALPTAVLLNDTTTVKRYLDEDPARINERGAHDFGLLWYPVIGSCDLSMTQLLLDRGAKIEHQHFLGTTALHWAAMRGPIELVELLVENGANVNRVGRKFNADGQTPLQLTRDDKVAAYLRSKGAI